MLVKLFLGTSESCLLTLDGKPMKEQTTISPDQLGEPMSFSQSLTAVWMTQGSCITENLSPL